MLRGLFSGGCFLCRGAARGVLCAACDAELPRLRRPCCPVCGLETPAGEVCGRCLSRPPAYDATVAALAYAFPADALVHALKFGGELALAPLLATLLGENIPPQAPVDFCIPVPLSPERLRTRGYNQAAEIARHVRRGQLLVAACERSRDTAPQLELPFAARRRNVKGCFVVQADVEGAAVAVVDDVMTTGATLDEMARTLKAAGASRVVNWVVARTLLE